MAKTVTLAELRTRSRERADMVYSTFISDTEFNQLINTLIDELHDLLTESSQDYAVSSTNITVGSGSNTIALPADFFKLRGLDLYNDPNDPLPVRRFNFEERNDFSGSSYYSAYNYAPVRYRLLGSNILLEPPEAAPGTYRVWYHPVATKLTSDVATFDGVTGWDEYVVVGVAIKALDKEKSDVGALLLEKEELKKRILKSAPKRDMGLPETITRVRVRNRSIHSTYFP